VSTGTIEEKIFQRQAAKQSLSASMIDNVVQRDDQLVFSAQDLRKLFLYKGHNTICETHETFKCKRCKNGKQHIKSQAMLYGDASTSVISSIVIGDSSFANCCLSWDHWTSADLKNNHDDLLRSESGGDDISFVFQYISH
jgi:DNA repair and recombination RAD54-like protein